LLILQCAIYCSVVDNFGDIGVCWRLARQLAHEHDLDITLWIDDLVSFSKLAPSLNPNLAEQHLDKIKVCLWHKDDRDAHNHNFQIPLDMIVEGFGCRLPDFVIENIAKQAKTRQQPLWINLEYLSAEAWAINCHLMPSMHPQTGLVQHFWFPGFSEKSGGLLREVDLQKNRDDFQNSEQLQERFWAEINIPDADQFDRRVSLFSYENKAICNLLNHLSTDKKLTLLLVPESKALTDISNWTKKILKLGDRIIKNSLTIIVLPFLNHHDYDRLLWACDLNFVRGEDSFVRAQWAGKPFIWHIYLQEEDAHVNKLNAFMDTVATIHQDNSWQQSMLAWNITHPKYDWSKILSHLTEWQLMTLKWQKHLLTQSSLTTKLIQFYQRN
jgi:uncharacterized repeat protein (TIGR03837 family)